jgi:hypothetical protein
VLIPLIDDGLERLLRTSLPLPVDQGEISFDTPSSAWSSQVNRLTVNLFLYDVSRSAQPPRPPGVRVDQNGARQRRSALPMVQLSYLVSAFAGSPRDEHSLLGDVITRLLAHQALPAELLDHELSSPVQLELAHDDHNRPRELWSGLGGTVRASFTLLVTVAADAHDWEATAPLVREVVGTAYQRSAPAAHRRPPGTPAGTDRRSSPRAGPRGGTG